MSGTESMSAVWYLVEGINPEPWQASEGSIGRKGGGTYIQFHKPAGLRAYQEALESAFKDQNPDWQLFDVPVQVNFYFWRQRETKESKANIADATNLGKSTEDALQGILYPNDRLVKDIRSRIVEQEPTTEPRILLNIEYLRPVDESLFQIARALHKELPKAPSNIREVPNIF